MNNYPRVVNVSNEGIRAVILPNGTASIWTEDGKEPFQHNRKIHETTALGVYTTKDAVAVLLSDNSIEVWGDPSKGGDILRNVQQEIKTYGANQVYSTGGAFAVLLGNKRVVTWGDSKLGGTIPPTIKHQIAKKEVKSVFSNDSAFIVITQDRSVYAWGDSKRGGKIPRIVQQEIETGGGILQLYSTKYAFAALLMNGQVVTWGDADYGGEIDDNSKAMIVEHGVKNIYSTDSAFAVLLGNKRVVAWGDDERGGDVNSMLEHGAVHWGYTVESIFSNKGAFVALIHIAISGGKGLLAWGDPENGGHIGDMTGSAIGNAAPIHVYATDTSFAAHLEDHRVVSWGGRVGMNILSTKPVYYRCFLIKNTSRLFWIIIAQFHGELNRKWGRYRLKMNGKLSRCCLKMKMDREWERMKKRKRRKRRKRKRTKKRNCGLNRQTLEWIPTFNM